MKPSFWAGSIAYDAGLMHAMHEVPLWVKLSATAAMLLIGLFTAWLMYFRTELIVQRASLRLSTRSTNSSTTNGISTSSTT